MAIILLLFVTICFYKCKFSEILADISFEDKDVFRTDKEIRKQAGIHREVKAMTSTMFSGSSYAAAYTLSQVRALAGTAQYNRWDREREREKEKDKKKKRKSEFEMHRQSMERFPEEMGTHFEARA